MNNLLLQLPAAINLCVTGIFAAMVLKQYLQRRRVYQLYWTIALTMAFLATLAYSLMTVVVPTSSLGITFFRIYYIFGAALMPAWLGLGSIALVSNPKVTRFGLILLSILSIISVTFLLTANVDTVKLSQIAGTPGTGILHPGLWLVMLILLNTLGVIAVVGVALYSGWKLLQRQKGEKSSRGSNLLWANILILVGDLLNAAAGSLARFLRFESTFWLIMAVGWSIFFAGVLLTSRRSRSSQNSVLPSEKLRSQTG